MLFGKPKSQLGVDIGSSNIKIAQLRPKDNQFVLETYGIVNVSYQIANKDSVGSVNETAEALKNLLAKAGVTTKKVVASLPNNSVFTSVIDMPKMSDSELTSAIEFEAKKYIPLPLPEVRLSWSIIQDRKTKITKNTNLGELKPSENRIKVLLTAVPTVVIDNYLKVFKLADLEVLALEIEALALIRSLVGDDVENTILIDIGSKSTSINLIDSGYLRLSKNLNVGGETITTSIAQSLNVNTARAEQFKKDFGLNTEQQQIPQIMRPILDIIKNEAGQLINLFESRGQRINKILLTGGGVKLPSLKDYFGSLGKTVIMADPWSRVSYPSDLKALIEPLAPNLAVAVGLAMRNF